MVAVDEATCERLFEVIEQEAVDVFYVKIPAEYGRTARRG
jgi:hypothetical protein